ncbi:rho GTPase-activating protein 7-like isoform X2 [Protopterus annectens]|uniref:rho GTPase-activating protein 7-like isoform X2 n=1 Tax=Protopterus annectens TaxID=7888 RepID=UPI001CFA703B|nr:rho GTPase-activating protein 7-like isoform X2 [Protopterus annectens]
MLVAEIEAKEACDWLRAAGFPQYVQLFEDCQFPLDTNLVKQDHEFLDRDAVDSLCRRLNTLNKYAAMKLEFTHHRKRDEDSDEEDSYAISNKWTFQKHNKSWSRLESLERSYPDMEFVALLPSSPCLVDTDNVDNEEIIFSDPRDRHDTTSCHSSSSTDSINFPKNSDDLETSRSSSRCSSHKVASPDQPFSCPSSPTEHFSLTCEERVLGKPPKKKGRSLLKKMETLRMRSSSLKKSSGSKGKPVISGPVLQKGFEADRLKHLNCINISEFCDGQSKGHFSSSPQTCSSSSPSENSSAVSTPSPVIRVRSQLKKAGCTVDFDLANESQWADIQNQNLKNERHFQGNLFFQIPQGHKPGTFPKALTDSILSPIDNTSVNWRTGSFHGCRRNRFRTSSCKERGSPSSPLAYNENRFSIYDNVPGIHMTHDNSNMPAELDDNVFGELDDVLQHVNGLQKSISHWNNTFSDDGDSDFANDSNSPCPPSPIDNHAEIKKDQDEDFTKATTKNTVIVNKEKSELQSVELLHKQDLAMESSLTHSNKQKRLPWYKEQTPALLEQISSQGVTRLIWLRKLALLKLTTLMDKYSPTCKQGWNWTIPKARKIKTIDYGNRGVFGVPLFLNVQRTGRPLPHSILQAMEFLRNHCLDQVGLFRKSGVKSRIQALREMNDTDPENTTYEGQSAFDVADMLKQYFRDLPEPIFTSRLCESFLHIYQYLPKDQHLTAVQAAIFLLPDENREALQSLLHFFREVVACVEENQMTPTNVAVCLAPSLFHLNTLRRENCTRSRSIQRKYSLGKPDQRDLSENLAATQGLAHMIADCTQLFKVPEGWLTQCPNLLEEHGLLCKGMPGLPSEEKYSSMLTALQSSIQDLLQDAKEGFRGWSNHVTVENVDLAFKKVEDEYPLRLWKASTEVGAPPEKILQRLLKEQHMWDVDMQESEIESLCDTADIYRFVTQSLTPQPPREYLVLRTWKTEPQTGNTVLAATSVDCGEECQNGIKGHVITCQYLTEPLGTQRCRLTHVCRTDTRGRTTEWYNKVFGHICAASVIKIRESFKQLSTDMKETKI